MVMVGTRCGYGGWEASWWLLVMLGSSAPLRPIFINHSACGRCDEELEWFTFLVMFLSFTCCTIQYRWLVPWVWVNHHKTFRISDAEVQKTALSSTTCFITAVWIHSFLGVLYTLWQANRSSTDWDKGSGKNTKSTADASLIFSLIADTSDSHECQ